MEPANPGYARVLGVDHTYVAPNIAGQFRWDRNAGFLRPVDFQAKRVFVIAG